jgi:hypothetical protein
MSALPVYQPRTIKRQRATKDETTQRRLALLSLAYEKKPAAVRQIFYAATVEGLVEKTEAGYATVKTDLVLLRRSGQMPYNWLADNTRWQRKPTTFNSIAEALNETARFYRKALWTDAADSYVELWLEKDALSGSIFWVTSTFDVPLMAARGYASLSFLHSAAEQIRRIARPTYIYHLGDFDPSGVNAGEKIHETLRGCRNPFRTAGCSPGTDHRLAPSDPSDQTNRQPRQAFWRGLGRTRRDRPNPPASDCAGRIRTAPPARETQGFAGCREQ